MGIYVVFGLSGYKGVGANKVTNPGYTLGESVFYLTFHKLFWGLALAWVVFACVNGYGGYINSFLSWGFFLPLAKLSYMVYLLHFDIVMAFFLSLAHTTELTNFFMVSP